mmetsp:Transcript_114880/g.203545  ORF Transcript_114880/g.203545 Transcript_114880/m.203545 type:complete len:231 (+) Transcript_114880:853-1545(+)
MPHRPFFLNIFYSHVVGVRVDGLPHTPDLLLPADLRFLSSMLGRTESSLVHILPQGLLVFSDRSQGLINLHVQLLFSGFPTIPLLLKILPENGVMRFDTFSELLQRASHLLICVEKNGLDRTIDHALQLQMARVILVVEIVHGIPQLAVVLAVLRLCLVHGLLDLCSHAVLQSQCPLLEALLHVSAHGLLSMQRCRQSIDLPSQLGQTIAKTVVLRLQACFEHQQLTLDA